MLRVQVKRRIKIIFLCTILIFISILSKLAYEQIFHHDEVLHEANELWMREFVVSGKRGSIYDRNGKVLAYDVMTHSIMVVPAQIMDKKKCASELSKILHCDEAALLKKISMHVSTQKLQPEGRRISISQKEKIEDLNMPGVYIVLDSMRYYPYHHLLSSVLGFTGIDNQGLGGLELQYNDYLSSKNGGMRLPFDAKGNPLENLNESYVMQGEGMHLELTIDHKIQTVLDRELSQALKKYRAKSAFGLAMDPNTGEILAMVSKPDFDSNKPFQHTNQDAHRILPIWMSFEPGSTLKSLTFAMALEEKKIDMFKDTYHDVGFEMVAGRRIKSWKAGGHGHQTYLQVLENSSNPGFVELSRKLGKKTIYQYLKDFGMMEKTNIDLPGESKGIMFQYDKMSELETATVAFGQGISTTPIQLACAFSSLVNGGIRYQPYMIKSYLDPMGEDIIFENQPKKIKRVLSKKTSDLMRYALESVVANGGGKNAYIQGYQIGGKTGTAQKVVNKTYSKSDYILSFLSGAPMNDPKIVLYIACDSPRNDILYGGTVMAPIAKSIYEEILPYLNVEKVEKQIPLKREWPISENIKVDHFIGKKKKDVMQEGVQFIYSGKGDIVLSQLPQAGTYLSSNQGKVWLYLGNPAE